ncbi:MAG: carboxypeptidase regulatory-like domain-containing protein [Candidatus Brocadiaceae bacterium]|nr:carboxypeptidase regulatory-like domain-containing protein [Candidatus Brocadiaceae bacterium]
MIKWLCGFVLCAVIGFSSNVFADLSSHDHPVFGVGTLTRDSDQGLEFLDPNLTLGRSYMDISSKFGSGLEFEGFRYATIYEVLALINNGAGFTPPAVLGQNSVGTSGIDWLSGLVGLLGETNPNRTTGISAGPLLGLGDARVFSIIDDTADISDRVYSAWTLDIFSSDDFVGSFLVQEVVLGFISGFTTDSNHIPIAGAEVWFWKQGTKTETVSDVNGYYIFEGLPSGVYNIVSKKAGYVEKAREKGKLSLNTPWGIKDNVNLVLE